jgi:hypothetical protein
VVGGDHGVGQLFEDVVVGLLDGLDEVVEADGRVDPDGPDLVVAFGRRQATTLSCRFETCNAIDSQTIGVTAAIVAMNPSDFGDDAGARLASSGTGDRSSHSGKRG